MNIQPTLAVVTHEAPVDEQVASIRAGLCPTHKDISLRQTVWCCFWKRLPECPECKRERDERNNESVANVAPVGNAPVPAVVNAPAPTVANVPPQGQTAASHCRGFKCDGTPCGTRYNLNDAGYCLHHANQAATSGNNNTDTERRNAAGRVLCRGTTRGGELCQRAFNLNREGYCVDHASQSGRVK